MIGRRSIRLAVVTAGTVLAVGIGVRAEQQTAAPAGPTAAEKFKNIQVLKDMPADKLPDAMQYITAALGVQCGFCHVQGPDGWHFDADDRPTKATARKMMQMVNTFNAGQNGITLNCATCHHGHASPERTPPLATEMTPEEAQAARERMATMGRGERGRGAPAPGMAPGRGAPGAPAGRGRMRPTETADDVIAKYIQAIGGQAAVGAAKTLVLEGTETMRDLQSVPVKVVETSEGQFRMDVHAKPMPSSRVFDGKEAWLVIGGQARPQEGYRGEQIGRIADLGRLTALKQAFSSLNPMRYGNIDGTETIVLVGRQSSGLIDQMQFDRQSGLLLRRTVLTPTPLGPIAEQIDYSDYRDAGDGLKVPFQVRWNTPTELNTLKFTSAKVNAPVDPSAFAKPAGK